jgi:hypothetical protein
MVRKLAVPSLTTAVAVCCVLVAFAPSGSAVAHGRAGTGGTWMAGPGCGRVEWFRHPAAFPYFCDGAAVVEKALWSNWGSSTARAEATFNEAVLNSHNNVASAPRRRSAVTIVASQIKHCDGRRAYSSVVIHYDKPTRGPGR